MHVFPFGIDSVGSGDSLAEAALVAGEKQRGAILEGGGCIQTLGTGAQGRFSLEPRLRGPGFTPFPSSMVALSLGVSVSPMLAP